MKVTFRGIAIRRSAVRWATLLWLLTAGIRFAQAASAATESVGLPGYLASSWEKLSSTLAETLGLRDKQETLPESAWLGADKSSNAIKINALLDQAIGILLQGEANDLRQQAARLRDEELPALRWERDDLRNRRIAAPESSRLPWVKTRAKIDARIAELDAEIKGRDRALSEINESVAGALRKLGLELDGRQIDILLTSVTGDDLFRNTVVFANVRLVVEKLAELSREDRDSLEISRRYTGMYLVLNDVLIVTQEGLVEKIDTNYKPQLATMKAEAEKLRGEAQTRARQPQYTQTQKSAFEANAKANIMTAQVAELYAELLEGQRKSAMTTLADLRRNRDLAENTYKTVRSTGDLRNLIRTGLDLFDSIQSLSLPRLEPFENDAIRREFEDINRRLKK
ncbi:MAG: hypothetical protein LBT15_05580 [Synergistaceae bacterium]|jgi:hypothetical protein|nr:hypothetical protein [Synergistaceae bacterium]